MNKISMESTSLDNPVWSALTDRQNAFSIGDGNARRFAKEFTKLAGLREPSQICFDSLAATTEAGDLVVLATLHKTEQFAGPWQWQEQALGLQMICASKPEFREHPAMEQLEARDVPEMMSLVKLTKPGPFAERSIEFGRFYGIKYGGKRIAMAGERLKTGSIYDEVSGVCTHPEFRGRGLAHDLVAAVCKDIFKRDHVPFLHVRRDNLAGIKSYERVGFESRCSIVFSILRKT